MIFFCLLGIIPQKIMHKKEKDNINYLNKHIPGISGICKMEGDASNREFYRIYFTKDSNIVMLYPQNNAGEIQQILRLSEIYKKKGINTPQNIDIIDNRIIIQEDLGDNLLQDYFSQSSEKEKKILLHKVSDILLLLKEINTSHATAVLDHTRMKWEMNFFLRHYYAMAVKKGSNIEQVKEKLYSLVDMIGNINRFAHRDFHSRNMLIRKGKIFLVDFQDSLQAPQYYDLVSFLFDSYLDMAEYKKTVLANLSKKGYVVDEKGMCLTALQRNIKALGTFGYQVFVQKNPKFKKYINATINNIRNNAYFKLLQDLDLF